MLGKVYLIFAVLVFLILLPLGGFYGYRLSKPRESSQPVQVIPDKFPSKFTGILRKVDIQEDQRARMQFDSDVYIVDIAPQSLASGQSTEFLYLNDIIWPLDIDPNDMVGMCVTVNGTLDPLSLDGDGLYYGEALLGGLVLQHPTIGNVAYSECKNIINAPMQPDGGITSTELTGVVTHINRPSADIPYDYVITTTAPIPGAMDMSGMERPITSVVVTPASTQVYEQLEATIGEQIKVKGYLQWGYAESQFFTVEEFLQ